MNKEETRGTVSTVRHTFWVRPDFEGELILPENLTELEAERLSKIVATFGRKLYEMPL